MQIPSRFTIGVHTLIFIALESEHTRVTSDYIASSVGVNPVIIRKILLQLRDAGLVSVARGVGGALLAKPTSEITLLDIYIATDSQGENGRLFGFHDNINLNCNIGRSMHSVLDHRLVAAQHALEEVLASQTLAAMLEELYND